MSLLTTIAKGIGYINPITAVPTAVADLSNAGSIIYGSGQPTNNAPSDAFYVNNNGGYSQYNGNIYGQYTAPGANDTTGATGSAGSTGYTGGYGTGSSGGVSTASYNPQQVAQFDQGINTVQSAIDRLNPALDISRGNINNQYNVNQNELNSGKAQAQNSYDTGVNQNKQQYVGNKNQILDQASLGLRGLLRMLGAHGAGGSSDALYAAPNAVNQVANQQRTGAAQTFGENGQNLDTNWNNYLTDFGNNQRKLDDWRTQQLNSAQASSDQTKMSLLQQLANLQSQKASYMGGNVSASAQPYLDQINSLGNEVNNLQAFNPTYTGVKPVYTAPNVASYTVNETSGPKLNTAQGGGDISYLNMLMGLNKDKQLQPTF